MSEGEEEDKEEENNSEKEESEKEDEEEEVTDQAELESQAGRYVVGHRIDVVWCRKARFLEFLDLIKFQGWEFLLSRVLENYMYPVAMTEFCQNFQAKLGIISSVVNGVKIEFNIETLGKIQKTPTEGYDTYIKGKGSVNVGSYLTSDIFEALGGQRGKKVMSHNDLSPLNKLLFNLVKKTILPRTA